MLHTQIVKSVFEQYPVVQETLADPYSRSRDDIRISRNVFDEMSERDVLTWTAMTYGYNRVGDITNAALLFEAMPDRDVAALQFCDW